MLKVGVKKGIIRFILSGKSDGSLVRRGVLIITIRDAQKNEGIICFLTFVVSNWAVSEAGTKADF